MNTFKACEECGRSVELEFALDKHNTTLYKIRAPSGALL